MKGKWQAKVVDLVYLWMFSPCKYLPVMAACILCTLLLMSAEIGCTRLFSSCLNFAGSYIGFCSNCYFYSKTSCYMFLSLLKILLTQFSYTWWFLHVQDSRSYIALLVCPYVCPEPCVSNSSLYTRCICMSGGDGEGRNFSGCYFLWIYVPWTCGALVLTSEANSQIVYSQVGCDSLHIQYLFLQLCYLLSKLKNTCKKLTKILDVIIKLIM